MNKKVFILPLVLLLALTGCKGKKNANKKGDVVNNLVLAANTKPQTKYVYSDYSLKDQTLPVDNISTINVRDGFLEIIDNTGKTFIYSVIKNSVIYSATFEAGDKPEYYPSALAGGYLRITIGDTTSVYDALGNELIKDNKTSITNFSIEDFLAPSGITVAHITINTNQDKYFIYDSNGKATLTLTVFSDDSSYEQGSSLQGIEYDSLADFGHKGYKRFKNSSRFVIFDNSNNEVASFTDPNGDAEFFVGDYLIYQNSVKLDDNNNNYDYINTAGERYSLETYRINYLTAKKEAIDVKYVLGTAGGDIKNFYNENGVYTYAYANLRTISDKKILSNTPETYIIDSAGAMHDNVTGIDLGAFVRFGNNYYNEASKTIYDGYLNEISILANLLPDFISNAELIICQKDGNYGAVNHEGKIAIPFEYDMIYNQYLSDRYLLAVKNGVLCRLTFNARECVISNTKQYEGYDTVNYVMSDSTHGEGIGVYAISGTATSGNPYPNYLSLFSDSPKNIQSVDGSVMAVKINTANAIDRSMFATLEYAGGQYTYRTSTISITH